MTVALDPTALDASAIAALLPHDGSMCLIDRVCRVDDTTLIAAARSHHDAANPLRGPQGLGSAIAIEYAAQAMALHAALRTTDRGAVPTAGVLASVRRAEFPQPWLDRLGAELLVRVVLVSGDSATALYEFEVGDTHLCAARGRAAVAFGARITASSTGAA